MNVARNIRSLTIGLGAAIGPALLAGCAAPLDEEDADLEPTEESSAAASIAPGTLLKEIRLAGPCGSSGISPTGWKELDPKDYMSRYYRFEREWSAGNYQYRAYSQISWNRARVYRGCDPNGRLVERWYGLSGRNTGTVHRHLIAVDVCTGGGCTPMPGKVTGWYAGHPCDHY